MLLILGADVPIPMGWILATLGILSTTISSLAAIIWATLRDRLKVQDGIIARLQDDVDRLSKGCGHETCHWQRR